jgi:5-methylcytosine-specific restriction endonuclease McrA
VYHHYVHLNSLFKATLEGRRNNWNSWALHGDLFNRKSSRALQSSGKKWEIITNILNFLPGHQGVCGNKSGYT